MTMTAMDSEMKLKMWGFWETYVPAGLGSKVGDIWSLVNKALLGVALGHTCSTISSTDFQA